MGRAWSNRLEIEGWEGSLKGWSEWIVPWEECGDEMRESQGQSLWNPSINPAQKRPLKGCQTAGQKTKRQRVKRQDSRTRNGQVEGKQTSQKSLVKLVLMTLS